MPVYEALMNFFSQKQAKAFESSKIIQANDLDFSNFQSSFKLSEFEPDEKFKDTLRWHVDMWLDHKFDILGTGWVSRNCGTKPVGFMGYTVPESVSPDDENSIIDWQLDIKSGYRWQKSKSSSQQVGFLDTPFGVDVKIPWELARLNHLPLLVYGAFLFDDLKERIIKEFRELLIDFVNSNPYKMGINWSNAMEVGIRLVNIVLATDFLIQLDPTKKVFDSTFKSIWNQAILEHTKFILEHSEFKNGLTNNHYYSNISALLFTSSFFKNTDSGLKLMQLAFEEVHVETKKQFLNDGGNFEASTHYHRLSTEMLLWNLRIINQNSSLFESDKAVKFRWNNYQKYSDKPSNGKIDELKSIAGRALNFSKAITKPNGNITGCGDQDSGRYIKLGFSGEFKCFEELKHTQKQIELGNYDENPKTIWWLENDLDQRNLQFMQSTAEGDYSLERQLFSDLLIPSDSEYVLPNTAKFNRKLQYHKKSSISFDSKDELNFDSLEWHRFPEFGLYIAKTNNFFFSVIATNNHLPRYWSHGKNDKLSFELQVNGKDIILDPGSFVYSADVKSRNRFRSTGAHSTIQLDKQEQNRWPKGKNSVFNLYNESDCQLISLSDSEIVLLCSYRKVIHKRTFTIHKDHLEILDECNKDFKVHFNKGDLHSNHYGRWINPEKKY